MTLGEKLARLSVGLVSPMAPLRDHCSWKIGGEADALVQPSTEEEILRLLAFVREEGVPFLVIGKGTNLLFSDRGFRGVVMKLGRRFSGLSIRGSEVRARGGLWVPLLAKNLAAAGLGGFEHAAGIPGSLGGLVTMNGGSLRHNVGEAVRFVEAVSLAGERRVFSREECAFAYRRSVFQDPPGEGAKRWIVLGAVMDFSISDPATVRREHLRVMEERRAKFPLNLPNCGSVFTNDPEVYELAGPPGRVIQDGDLKGTVVGGAQISTLHGNFIVNLGGATAADVLALIGLARRRVHDRIGRWLRCEVRYADEWGEVTPASEVCP